MLSMRDDLIVQRTMIKSNMELLENYLKKCISKNLVIYHSSLNKQMMPHP